MRRRILVLLLILVCLLSACGTALPSGSPTDAAEGSAAPPVPSPPEPAETAEAPAASSEPEQPPVSEPAESEATDPVPSLPSPEPEPQAEPADESWKLLLVNADHPLPEDFTVNLKDLRNGHHVDERIYPELQQMFDDAREQGIYPLINESFRTSERQQEIMDKYIAGYEAEGMSHSEAEKAAREIVALPGTSEHQLGLALDIVAEYDADSTATWQWLLDNCRYYGFILRYPADKMEITGIAYEPWHFRYVGVEAAEEIMTRGITLEEYLAERSEP